ncbi:hypothetical protein D3C81_2326100 [compost metagenome]
MHQLAAFVHIEHVPVIGKFALLIHRIEADMLRLRQNRFQTGGNMRILHWIASISGISAGSIVA